MFELLAPSGSFKKMKFAFEYGADAVYMGLPDFSLRARLNDYNIESVYESIDYAHKIGKKVYVTFNIFAHNSHIKNLENSSEIKKFLSSDSKPDAVICSDPGIILWMKENFPDIDIHLSTQMNTLNYKAVEFWKKFGVKRIILGRECTLEDIITIKKEIPDIEIEYFVHGSMCMAYSGRCFLSKFFLNKSANLGECTHPCRFPWKKVSEIENENIPRQILLEEDEKGSYFFSSYDMCMIENMKELVLAGVDSFKIEGRTKSVFYVSSVSKAYRDVLDNINSSSLSDVVEYNKNELEKLVSRGYTTGFLHNEAKVKPSNISNIREESGYRFVGEVVLKNEKSIFDENNNYVLVHNKIISGSYIEVVLKKGKNLNLKVEKIIDPDSGEELTEISSGFEKAVILVFDRDIKLEEMTLLIGNEGKKL